MSSAPAELVKSEERESITEEHFEVNRKLCPKIANSNLTGRFM